MDRHAFRSPLVEKSGLKHPRDNGGAQSPSQRIAWLSKIVVRAGDDAVESLGVPSAAEISEAIVVWTGWAVEYPARDDRRVVDRFGKRAHDLVQIVRRLQDEFYESDARFTVAGLGGMGDAAAARFRELHPELTNEAVEAFAWCYTYDYK